MVYGVSFATITWSIRTCASDGNDVTAIDPGRWLHVQKPTTAPMQSSSTPARIATGRNTLLRVSSLAPNAAAGCSTTGMRNERDDGVSVNPGVPSMPGSRIGPDGGCVGCGVCIGVCIGVGIG